MAVRPAWKIPTGYNPKMGSRALPVNIDFTASLTVSDTLSPEELAGQIDFIQTIFIDNSLNSSTFSIQFLHMGQILKAPAKSQAILPVMNFTKLAYTATSGANLVIPVIFSNMFVQPTVWSGL